MTLEYWIWLFFKPSHVMLILALVGVVFWRNRFGLWCRSIAATLLIVLGLLPTGTLLVRPLEARFSAPVALGEIDGIIVLSGGELLEQSLFAGSLQLNSAGDRLTTFVSLASRYPRARLIHSGLSQEDSLSRFVSEIGIDSNRITFDFRSSNTCDSATNTKALANPGVDENWLLVTSAMHMPRTIACFRAADWDVIPFPTDYRRTEQLFYLALESNLEDLDLAAHEWLGLLYYRLNGLSDELFPSPTE